MSMADGKVGTGLGDTWNFAVWCVVKWSGEFSDCEGQTGAW